jgi:hypothetical protein
MADRLPRLDPNHIAVKSWLELCQRQRAELDAFFEIEREELKTRQEHLNSKLAATHLEFENYLELMLNLIDPPAHARGEVPSGDGSGLQPGGIEDAIYWFGQLNAIAGEKECWDLLKQYGVEKLGELSPANMARIIEAAKLLIAATKANIIAKEAAVQ